MSFCSISSTCSCGFPLQGLNQRTKQAAFFSGFPFSKCTISVLLKPNRFPFSPTKVMMAAKYVKNYREQGRRLLRSLEAVENRKEIKKGKKEHHLWKKRDSAGSGQKARNLIRIITDLPNEKEAVYGALNKWVAWETEFPVIAAAKALQMLRKRSQWRRVIQVVKWLLSKGQCTTITTYDTLLLAFDMDQRVDEAESFWNMIVLTHTRSIPKRLFSRMISLYDHHNMQDKIIEVFADMEELGVRPDEDTTRRVARAFGKLGHGEKKKLVLKTYLGMFKYIHSNGERVRVRRYFSDDE